MLKIVEKYITFDSPRNMHMKEKVSKCKTVFELQELFLKEKHALSVHLIKKIENDLNPKKGTSI